mmetsp:Transcript_18817/g.23092  ORF Transcript_18817/g.23092 Transcript_18817/m.23092 type:complete len:463 (+) Transcript_18817:125-1513(+)
MTSISKGFNLHRRVVVTGIGAVSPLGKDFTSTWKHLTSPESTLGNDKIGITTLEEAIFAQNLPSDILGNELKLAKLLPSQVAAPVRNVQYDARTSRFVQLALIAAQESLHQSGLWSWLGLDNCTSGSDESKRNEGKIEERQNRIGTCIGSGMSSVREIISAHETVTSKNSLRRLSPHFVPKVLCNSASSRVALEFQLKGPNLAPSTACAAGAHAIGEAMRCIQYGDVDIMIAGGAEACIDPISMGGFARLKALSTKYNDNPIISSRPFDRDRDGFVMGEGSCVLVLEEMEHAIRRGAPILCEIKGYGISGDAYHVTSPDPEGTGAERAMKMALNRAQIDPGIVDYVNAHATSTPIGDAIEEGTIDRVAHASAREKRLYVSSTKGATGHLLGACGAIEAAFSVMSIVDGIIPPTRNLESYDQRQFQHVSNSPVHDEINVSISNSFGFGGTNVAIVFSSLDLKR